jgi:hypothetical protein
MNVSVTWGLLVVRNRVVTIIRVFDTRLECVEMLDYYVWTYNLSSLSCVMQLSA